MREAARVNGYTWKDWLELARHDQIDGLAYFRLRRIIDMNVDDAQSREAERRARQKRSS